MARRGAAAHPAAAARRSAARDRGGPAARPAPPGPPRDRFLELLRSRAAAQRRPLALRPPATRRPPRPGLSGDLSGPPALAAVDRGRLAPARPPARGVVDVPVVARRPGTPRRADRRVRDRRKTQAPRRPGRRARPRAAAHPRRRRPIPLPGVQLAGLVRGPVGQRERLPRGALRADLVGLEPGPPVGGGVRGGPGHRAQARSPGASLVVRDAAVVAERPRLRRRRGRPWRGGGRLRRPAGERRLRPPRVRGRRPADRLERPRDAPPAARGADRDRPVRDARRYRARPGGHPRATEPPPRRIRRGDPHDDLQLAGRAPRQLRPAGRAGGPVGVAPAARFEPTGGRRRIVGGDESAGRNDQPGRILGEPLGGPGEPGLEGHLR